LRGELQALLTTPYWSDEQSIAEAENITVADVKAFVPQLLASLRIDAMFHGNGDENDARTLLALVTRYLHPSATAVVPRFSGVVKMPARTRVVDELAIAHDDSAIIVYQQGVDNSLRSRALVNLLATLMEPSFFDTLRTQQQLGYVVSAGTLPILNVNGLTFTIESPVADPLVLEQRINVFLASYGSVLAAMTDEQFNGIKSGLLNELTQLPTQMNDLSGRYWGDILLEETTIDSQLKMAGAVAQLSRQDAIDYYRDVVMAPGAARVVARSTGRNHLANFLARRAEAAGTILLDGSDAAYENFKNGKSLYTYP
jgi:secreted Zn-dependent insulinase-like peptidase